MFKIDTASNSILPLKVRTFGELGFKERNNLQEWIAKEPSCLGEDFLVIQKEFSGFSDTHERLDILALDKQGFWFSLKISSMTRAAMLRGRL